jgi:diadenosine tetraphosphatase ApaH/serine/threonine PP2A family protein phosphatase
MHIAILTDVHANLEALTACLAHAEHQGARQFAFLGDHVGYGADPAAVVDTIRERIEGGAIAVAGNHDLAVAGSVRMPMQEDARRVVVWTRGRLRPDQTELLRLLPLTQERDGRLYVHANAWAPAQWEYVTGPVEAGRSIRATSCRITFCGHVHEPTLYHMTTAGRVLAFSPVPGTGIPLGSSRRWLAIPGSSGQPRDGNPAACYALFDDTREVLTYFRVPYDHEAAARKVRAAGLPESLGLRLRIGF